MLIDKSILFLVAMFLYPVIEGLKDGNTLSRHAEKYHLYGWLARALVSVCIIPVWYWLPLYCAYFWLVFDGFRNVSAGDPILFVGSTAYVDKTFGRNIIYVKLVLLVASIIFLLIKLSIL